MTTKRFTLFAIILVAFAFFVGCKKEKDQKNDVKPSCNNPSMTIVSELARYSRQSDFKNAVYKMVYNKFDGDVNALCKDILSKTKGNPNDTIMNALQYYQQQGLYPQIYIPYFEEVQKRGNENGIVFINAIGADESQSAFQGYCLENDTIVETPFLIDEEYAMNHEVWVISINERVDENGNPLIDNLAKTREVEEQNGQTSARVGKKHECVKQINCPHLSEIESWIYGAPELKCICHSHLTGNLTEQFFYPSYRSDINNNYWTVDNGNSRKMYYWDVSTVSKHVNFLWLELDNSGATRTITNTYSFQSDNGTSNTVTYTYQKKADDQNCGSYTPNYDDGCIGVPYETGLISWKDEYKTIPQPIHVE